MQTPIIKHLCSNNIKCPLSHPKALWHHLLYNTITMYISSNIYSLSYLLLLKPKEVTTMRYYTCNWFLSLLCIEGSISSLSILLLLVFFTKVFTYIIYYITVLIWLLKPPYYVSLRSPCIHYPLIPGIFPLLMPRVHVLFLVMHTHWHAYVDLCLCIVSLGIQGWFKCYYIK